MKKKIRTVNKKQLIYQPERLEMYRAFMTGYVKRINEATFNVSIGGIRIGLAKYSRLAQINLEAALSHFLVMLLKTFLNEADVIWFCMN